MTFQEHFEKYVDNCLQCYTGKTLILFKGFGIKQIHYLIGHSQSILPCLQVNNDSIDFAELNEKGFDMIGAIRKMEYPLVGFYEEWLAISKYSDLMPLDNINIVLIENNMLAPWTPCLLAQEDILQLFDCIHEDKEAENVVMKTLMEWYGEVKILPNEKAIVKPVDLEADGIERREYWAEQPVLLNEDEIDVDHADRIDVGSDDDWLYRLNLLDGNEKSALFLIDLKEVSKREKALAEAFVELHLPCAFDEIALYRETPAYLDKQFLPVLKKYWGPKAEFRTLQFYKNPDYSDQIEKMSQGQIIAEIVDQCERAMNHDFFRNMFITAPTGSGKSILFQVPAIYLAEKYQSVTVVISPLIALMNDQVDHLQHERGITIAACIHSSMSIEERRDVILGIQNGEISLVYMAPELLLSTHLSSFFGGRKIGLIVIDEAHTVTSWGKDFRSDYWFLGDFLQKSKRDGLLCPVLCLTATAVYSGPDDMVNETINELGLEHTIIHLGNVKRDNIIFDIINSKEKEENIKWEEYKIKLVLDYVRKCVEKGEKVLAYFPFRTQVEQAYRQLDSSEHIKIRRYHAKISPSERHMAEIDYKKGVALGLCCTKAFGMGIDVGDIQHVVHLAPSGTLADYVQEIGRAARNKELKGIAHMDFFARDLSYVKRLNSISEMRQYQLREMLKKLTYLYKVKKQRNLLISPETFSYLFSEDKVEGKTKSGLRLLEEDLKNKYSFPVLVVRPKAVLSQNYVNVPYEIEKEWMKKYGQYVKRQAGSTKYIIPSQNCARYSDTHVKSTGDVYLVDMEQIWEHFYPEQSFGMFKKLFFEEKFTFQGGELHVSPRVRVTLRYKENYEEICKKIERLLDVVINIFGTYKHADQKKFTQEQFKNDLLQNQEIDLTKDKVPLLLDLFTQRRDENYIPGTTNHQIRVVQKRREIGAEEDTYFVSSLSYAQLKSPFLQQLSRCRPNREEGIFTQFLPIHQNQPLEITSLLILLELMNLASYEMRGGEKAEIFLRINDPYKIEQLSKEKYTNNILRSIQKKHKDNQQLLKAFFSSNLTTSERWLLIERYFLGDNDYVCRVLGLQQE